MKFRVKHERLVNGEMEDVTEPETISRDVDVIEWFDEKMGDIHEPFERLTIEVRE